MDSNITFNHRVAHAGWWSALEIAARYGVQLVVMVVLARLLTPADFGLIAMLLVFTNVGAVLVDGGFGAALIQRRHVTADDETTACVFSVASGSLVAAILWLCASLIADFYQEPELAALTRLVAWVLPLGGLAAVPDALLAKRLEFNQRAAAELIASVVAGTTALVLASRGLGVWSIAWQAVVAMALRALCLGLFAHWLPRGRFTTAAFGRLFGFGGFVFLARLLESITRHSQFLLVGWQFKASALGYYALAQNTQQAPADLIGTLLNRLGLPVFAELAEDPAGLRRALQQALRLAMFLFLPCMVCLAVIARPLIGLVYGSRWEVAAPVMSLLALASALIPLHVLNMAALTAQGRSDRFLRVELIKKLIAIVMIVAASPLGPLAVATAVLVASLLDACINTYYTRHMLDYGLLAQLRDQAATLVLAVLAAAVGALALHADPTSLPRAALAVALGGGLYIGGALALRCQALRELHIIVRAIFQGRPPVQSLVEESPD